MGLPLELELLAENFSRQVETMSLLELRGVAISLHRHHLSSHHELTTHTKGLLATQQEQIVLLGKQSKDYEQQIARLKEREARRRKGDRLALGVSAVFVVLTILTVWLRPAAGKICRGDARRDYPPCTTEVRDARDAV
jgi:hypothetical protein